MSRPTPQDLLLPYLSVLVACAAALPACSSPQSDDPLTVLADANDTQGSSDTADADDAQNPPADANTDSSADTAQTSDVSSDTTADPDPPTRPDTLEWLALDDDSPKGRLQYSETPKSFYEFQRFRAEKPVRIWSLKARVAVPEKMKATLYVWDDFGGNFINFDYETPLASTSATIEPAADGEYPAWTEFKFDKPVTLDPERLFYVGLIADGKKTAQLMVDAKQPNPDDKPPASLIWRSEDPANQSGGPAISASPGHFMIRAGVEPIRTVAPTDRNFEVKKAGDVGLESLRRMALADVDGDGDLDVMKNGPKLFLNDGSGQFRDVSKTWLDGISSSNGGIFGDFDNDGDPDYFAAGKKDKLLRNDGDTFVDVTASSGIDDTSTACGDVAKPLSTEAVAWVDVDGDGWLDLYQANYQCSGARGPMAPDRLWRNKGDGTFERMPLPVGTTKTDRGTRAGRGVAPADADGDGDVDVLVANYRLDPNSFLLNDDGTLRDRSPASNLIGEGTARGFKTYYGHSIGAAWGDINADGRLDVFVANLAHPRFIGFSHKSALYRNTGKTVDGAPRFEEVTKQAGIRYQETPSNPNLWDYDNDGDLDLFFTCVYDNRPSQFYRNDGHPSWEEVSYETGVSVDDGWGSAVGDLDGDGDLDLLAKNRVFINRNPSGRGAVFVDPVGGGAGKTNVSGIGARVTATIKGKTVLRERYGGHGTGVQDSPWLHVGLNGAQKTDLTVKFPATGNKVTVKDAKAGERITVHEDGTVER